VRLFHSRRLQSQASVFLHLGLAVPVGGDGDVGSRALQRCIVDADFFFHKRHCKYKYTGALFARCGLHCQCYC